jgi:hypothetical protein
MDRICQWCGGGFRVEPNLVRRGHGNFCCFSCARFYQWSQRPSGVGYRDVRAPDHPLATASGNVKEHRIILYGKLGAGTHPCHWCDTPVTWTPGGGTRSGVLIVDHVDGDKRNNAISNLVPSCHRCNIWRNPPQEPIRDDELFCVAPNGARYRAVQKNCEYCGEPFLAKARLSNPKKGRFCSRSCARRGSYTKPVNQVNRASRIAQTHCKRGHPLTGLNLGITARGARRCLTCHQLRNTAYRERKRQER